MNKRDVILSLAGNNEPLPYIPAAFFLHFPDEFHAGQAAVDKHLEYFRYTGMDLVKIQFESKFPQIPTIQKAADWAKMPRYGREFYEGQLAAVKGLVEAAKSEAVVIVTLYSSFMCAVHTTDAKVVATCLDENPEQVKAGFEIINDSLLWFVRECAKLGVDGFYTSTQGGEGGRFKDPATFEKYIRPFDLDLMDEANRLTDFNILHVCDYQKEFEDFSPFVDYPGTIVNSPLKAGNKLYTPVEIAEMFKRPFMGGLERKGTLATGTPEQIQQAVKDVIASSPPRFLLAADCTVPNDTPWDNLKIAIDTAHSA